MAESIRKAKLLYLIEILKNETDEQHPLSAEELCERLANYGISAERKAIYDDITTLCDCNYDIIKTASPKRGYFWGNRDFEAVEVRLLVDAVQSADFISRSKTDMLIEKLKRLVSMSEAEDIKRTVHVESRPKSENESIYYIIDEINKGIQKRKKIEFDYGKLELYNGKLLTRYKHHRVSPYAFIWDNDHYYLVANNEKYDNLMHLRVDKMKNVRLTAIDYRHFGDVSDYKYQFDTADYAKKAFNMFSGETKRIDIECSTRMLDQIHDKFGSGLWLRSENGSDKFRFSTNVCVSEGLVGWLMQYGKDVRVLFPPELKEQMKQRAKELNNLYNS